MCIILDIRESKICIIFTVPYGDFCIIINAVHIALTQTTSRHTHNR